MGRRASLVPLIDFKCQMPEDLHTRLTLHLFSDLEQRVPYGAWTRFFTGLVREFFSSREIDLAPWAGTEPGAILVRGTPESLAILKKVLTGEIPS